MYGTGGQVNRMSDDLISRKAVLNILTEARVKDSILCSPAFPEILAQRIRKLPTAFDKERVIDELVELRQIEYNDSDEEPELLDGEEIYDEGRSQGRFEAYHRAIEIVEKGGIE